MVGGLWQTLYLLPCSVCGVTQIIVSFFLLMRGHDIARQANIMSGRVAGGSGDMKNVKFTVCRDRAYITHGALNALLAAGAPFIRTVRRDHAPVKETSNIDEHGTCDKKDGKIFFHRCNVRSFMTIELKRSQGLGLRDGYKWMHVVIDEPNRDKLVHIQYYGLTSVAESLGWIKERDVASTNADDMARAAEQRLGDGGGVLTEEEFDAFLCNLAVYDSNGEMVTQAAKELTRGQASGPTDSAWWFIRPGFMTSTRMCVLLQFLSDEVLDETIDGCMFTLRDVIYPKGKTANSFAHDSDAEDVGDVKSSDLETMNRFDVLGLCDLFDIVLKNSKGKARSEGELRAALKKKVFISAYIYIYIYICSMYIYIFTFLTY